MSPLAACLLVLAQRSELPAFQLATPESQGLQPAWLDALGQVVQGYVDEGKIVGAELLVIRNDHAVLHRGFGWRHREEEVPMAPGGVFCLRSMTKAVVGAAVQILIDEERLSAGDPVAKYLPSFDNERSRAITIEQLLTHTSGLPLSSLLGVDLAQLAGERAIADLTGEKGPEFPPGERYHYSDDNADVLGALVEIASGKGLEEFLRERLFDPLGMQETAGVMTLDHPLRERVCSKYAGGPGAWSRYWSPEDAPLFRFLLASQGLYGSALDYARFLRLWKEKGRAGEMRLLSFRAVRHGLDPRNPMRMPTGFAGLAGYYGEMMQLWIDPAAEKGDRLVAFGHGGSDGTYSWVLPALDLMVLYFTQSRNSASGIELEAEIQRLLLDPLLGAKRAPPASYTPEELEAFTGVYWEEDDGEYSAVLRREGTLFVEFPGQAILELRSASARDRFELKLAAGIGLEFERDAEGAVVAATGFRPEGRERMPRLEPAVDLPSVDELLALKQGSCDWTKLSASGALRIRSTLDLPALKLHGTGSALVQGLERLRSENDFGTLQEKTALDGERGWTWNSRSGLEELSGVRLAEARLEHPFLPIADWRALYRELRVLARVERGGVSAFLVRAIPSEGNPQLWTVAADTGLPLAHETITAIPGMGEVGSTTEFGDWREVGALRLPFHWSGRFASSFLGRFEVRWESVETEADVPGGSFTLEEPEAQDR